MNPYPPFYVYELHGRFSLLLFPFFLLLPFFGIQKIPILISLLVNSIPCVL